MSGCDRHQEVKEKLDDHEDRINKLEISDARMSVKMENLIAKLDNLANWIKALVLLGATALVGFFIWYIQNIGNQSIGG